MNLGDAMKRSKVLDVQLQKQLYPHMKDIKPLPSMYFPDFIAANQNDRADNVLTGTKQEQMEQIQITFTPMIMTKALKITVISMKVFGLIF